MSVGVEGSPVCVPVGKVCMTGLFKGVTVAYTGAAQRLRVIKKAKVLPARKKLVF